MNFPLKFEDVKEKIIKVLESRGDKIGINEPLNLMEGFFFDQYTNNIEENMKVEGQCMPSVCLVGIETGRLYYFSLGSIIGEVFDINKEVES